MTSLVVEASSDVDAVVRGEEEIRARYKAPPFSVEYFPGREQSSSSKFWKARSISSDLAYAVKSLATTSLSLGNSVGDIMVAEVDDMISVRGLRNFGLGTECVRIELDLMRIRQYPVLSRYVWQDFSDPGPPS